MGPNKKIRQRCFTDRLPSTGFAGHEVFRISGRRQFRYLPGQVDYFDSKPSQALRQAFGMTVANTQFCQNDRIDQSSSI